MSEETVRLVKEGWRQIGLGEHEKGCFLIHEAIRLEPWNHEHYLTLGCAYCASGQPKTGFEYFTYAQLISPDDFRGWYYAGASIVLYWESHDLLKKEALLNALPYFDEATRLKPDDPHVLCSIGKCHEFMYEWAKAARVYEHVLQIEPQFTTAARRMKMLKSMNN
ncbi:MAG: hypothetical protein A2846_04765 [Candidatus Doudnabacteria bacterium RIFCSPHIGHO2_01_FULL_49_9]|uniref:Uncharacterized protein n=1 Tax=Candidatus Doudnabacteria bacterium RIFCSPHIGHO2_01_FULL_49_9 TaxID=1817827 RepID=A0A1F5P201_9BACT|nr:MAG: hypothetical protein A2846_04765 [Candidatus Doudnabacteria bacterium RIFCSPHIGHO2_01_FULL_49_9]